MVQDLESKVARQTDEAVRQELRMLLNRIISYSAMSTVEAETANSTELVSNLEKINKTARDAAGLVDNFLASRGRDASNTAPVELAKSASAERAEDKPNEKLTGEILVVDDNALNRDMLSRRLRSAGHTVTLAEDGVQALELVHSLPFDLILLDVMMPGADGYQVLGELKRTDAFRNIPVVMISALTEIESIVKCIEMGADDYLPKPINPTLLNARVGSALEKKRLREEEQAYRERALKDQAALERHRSLAEMAAGMAHEINTPLGIARTAASIIDKRLSSPSIAELFEKEHWSRDVLTDIFEASTLLHRNIARAHRLIENFKKISVGQIAEQKETIELPSLIVDTVELFNLNAREAHLSIHVDASNISGDKRWYGHPGYLTQVIINLLQNVERYAYPGGKGGKVDITIEDDGDTRFVITFRDYGEGIKKENLKKIFEPFFTTGRAKGGSGIGLAIVHNIVTTALHGSIEVCSEFGKGAIFRTSIPKVIEQ
jgi:signal transduction histidine kinase